MIKVSESGNNGGALLFPDMTALLDVIFILLVFLLLTANAVPKALDIQLPEDAKESAKAVMLDNQITVSLFVEEGRWGLMDQEFETWESFEMAAHGLLAGKKDPKVVIAGHKQVNLEKVLKLFGFLQENNLAAAKILMKQSEGSSN